ncbi:MAG TPA: hypothetical protein VGJ39_16045 [Vicinamibacterales bacterium]
MALSAVLGGTSIAIYYHRLGLTLSHYDARGHLVVARRIIDSLTPGWQQIGAVWLPLPHLLNALPVQVDAWYRSGASAVAISIVAFAVAVGAISWIVLELTGSPAAAVAGAGVFALNPNVLYLQATPMTEPLLLGLTTLAVAMLLHWTAGLKSCATTNTAVGCVFALACMTRYEAWPVTFAALAAAVWARWRQGDSPAVALRRVGAIALFPIGAIAGFLVFSRVVIGRWFVASGFFTPENKALGDPMMAAAEIWYGLHALSGSFLVAIGAAGAAALMILGLAKSRWVSGLIVLSLAATAALPWLAFIDGHPFRIRYMVPLIAIEAIGVGYALGIGGRALERRFSAGSASSALIVVAVLGLVAYELRPLDLTAPMVVEAQWDRPNVPVREEVTACLGRPQPGEKIMASMGSLGHYMQEASRAGFQLRDFLHEGNGDIWLAALATGPRPFADWVLVEEKAEGGDMLAARAREQPHFLDGYSRVCDGAGLALYRRQSVITE